ncbi:MAG: single-stranded DNA-binding protein, partial [Clostridia bacterium]|nr:single-stranded DNA-binding protein [Clostridia bacterium]
MQTSWNENKAVLRGVVAAAPVFSHENHGVPYDTFPLSVLRLSGAEDRINVVAARPLLDSCPAVPGEELEVTGEVRSFNNRGGEGSRLVITLYARSLEHAQG